MAPTIPSDKRNPAMKQQAQQARQASRQHAARQHAAPSRTVSVDNYYDPVRNTRFEQMFASDPPANNMLARATTFPNQHWGSTNQYSEGRAGEGRAGEGRAQYNNNPNAQRENVSDVELDRLERLAAVRERLARIPPPLGHRYGKLRVGKNARAVRGNVFRGACVEARILARRHTYDDASAEDEAGLIEGEMEGEDIDDFFSRRTDAYTYYYGEQFGEHAGM